MITQALRDFANAKNFFEANHVTPAQRLLDATTAIVAEARADQAATQKLLDQLRPVWAQGWTKDSEAAQASANALAQLWHMLGVDNQTAAVLKLEELMK